MLTVAFDTHGSRQAINNVYISRRQILIYDDAEEPAVSVRLSHDLTNVEEVATRAGLVAIDIEGDSDWLNERDHHGADAIIPTRMPGLCPGEVWLARRQPLYLNEENDAQLTCVKVVHVGHEELRLLLIGSSREWPIDVVTEWICRLDASPLAFPSI